jgi:hypothetical protein
MLLTDIPLMRKHIYENPTPWKRSVWQFGVRWTERHRHNAKKPSGVFPDRFRPGRNGGVATILKIF